MYKTSKHRNIVTYIWGFFLFQFGQEQLSSMPNFISSTVTNTVFHLLRHEQLTVREYAIKTYTCYISKSHLSVSIELF